MLCFSVTHQILLMITPNLTDLAIFTTIIFFCKKQWFKFFQIPKIYQFQQFQDTLQCLQLYTTAQTPLVSLWPVLISLALKYTGVFIENEQPTLSQAFETADKKYFLGSTPFSFFLDGSPNDQLLTIHWQISWLPAPWAQPYASILIQ